jgi:hypothetical protein
LDNIEGGQPTIAALTSIRRVHTPVVSDRSCHPAVQSMKSTCCAPIHSQPCFSTHHHDTESRTVMLPSHRDQTLNIKSRVERLLLLLTISSTQIHQHLKYQLQISTSWHHPLAPTLNPTARAPLEKSNRVPRALPQYGIRSIPHSPADRRHANARASTPLARRIRRALL